jgi:polar amino acid transport system substrate-binding protein
MLLRKFYFVVLWFFLIVAFDSGTAGVDLVIVTNELPPYVSQNENDDFVLDILNEIAREMGVRFSYEFLPWKRCEIAVDNHDAWAAVPYVPNSERKMKFLFSDKLYNKQSLFFSYRSSGSKRIPEYTRISDLKPYRIGGVRGYYYEPLFAQEEILYEPVESEEMNFRKLKAGRIDLVPSDELTGWFLIRRLYPDDADSFYTLSKPLDASGNFLMVSKTYPDAENLLRRFNTSMKIIKNNGVFRKIVDRHHIVLTF